ncbi:MAG: hypothetical protein PWQ45_110 [Thermosipho sp. (in: thermotogales)]|nr:hypothetical protein [Thermosipho sp. (in: thermotogales)]
MTYQDYVNMIVKQHGYNWGKTLLDFVRNDSGSVEKDFMRKSLKYYKNDNDSKYFTEKEVMINPHVFDYDLQAPMLFLLIDQKVGFSLGHPINKKFTKDNAEKEFNEIVDEKKFNNVLKDIYIDTSINGVNYMHIYVENKELKFKAIDGKTVIPIYKENDIHDDLEAIIRYYEYYNNDKAIIRIEFWDKEKYEFWDATDDDIRLVEEGTHFQGGSWGAVPFIEFRNNEYKIPDLKFVKGFIDKLDRVEKLEGQEYEMFKQKLLTLIGYTGTNREDLVNLVSQMKEIGVIPLRENGELKFLEANINTANHRSTINETKRDIYLFGRGANYDLDKFGNNQSGVALKYMFAPLESKCQNVETQFLNALDWFNYFVEVYGKMYNKRITELPEYEFNHKQMINEKEKAEIRQIEVNTANSLNTQVTDETRLSQYPFIEDPEEEAKKLDEQLFRGE